MSHFIKVFIEGASKLYGWQSVRLKVHGLSSGFGIVALSLVVQRDILHWLKLLFIDPSQQAWSQNNRLQMRKMHMSKETNPTIATQRQKMIDETVGNPKSS
ncbi:hypothetical protein CEXT_8651 [Caerostris extrusa]|uniref:Uncharacterized protein n=1 Tax=Caerostris extrusa TaxID=172846 RepID=A0AAV4UVC1_CAEEX|nr:hypothetical protein CEXT_8651 [Caerostris extrusa]